MKANIVLRCDGRIENDFCFCSGTQNVILNLNTIRASSNYIDLIRYLDKVTKIFDGPCFKLNVISNTIYKIYEMGYITEQLYKHIAFFYQMHKYCGLSIACVPN